MNTKHVAGNHFPWMILLIILMAPLITVIDVFIMNISLPTIQQFFHASDAGVQGVIAAYLVGYAVFLITGSRAGDHFGRKRVFMLGLAGFTIASALCGFAGTIGQLVLFRFLQGIAAGFAAPQTFTLIQLNFTSEEHRAKALGYFGITLGISAIIGQFLGGYLVTSHLIHDSWRLIFLINVPIGITAVSMAAFYIPESKQEGKAKFDIGGTVLLTLALTALVYPIIVGRELGWPSWTLFMIGGALTLIWLFIQYQADRITKEKNVLVPLQLFNIRSFNLGLGMVMFYFASYSTFLMTCALLLQQGLHVPPLTSGLYFVIVGVTFMYSSHWSIKNAKRFGNNFLYFATLLVLMGFGVQLVWFNSAISLVAIATSFTLYGLGAGMLVPSFLKIALRDVPPAQAGLASGVYSTVQQFSSALGVSIFGGVFFHVAESGGHNFVAGYKAAVICMMISYAMVGLMNYLLTRRAAPRAVTPSVEMEFVME
jgi:EmrB/QacA subfamily drug resistance transporter